MALAGGTAGSGTNITIRGFGVIGNVSGDETINAGATEYLIVFSEDGMMRVISSTGPNSAANGQPCGGVNIQIRAPHS